MTQKISRKIANSIEKLFDNESDDVISATIFNIVHCSPYSLVEEARDLKEYYKDNIVGLLDAIVNGYEVEETQEEKVLGMYERAVVLNNFDPCQAYRLGMKDFARIFNIYVNWDSQ